MPQLFNEIMHASDVTGVTHTKDFWPVRAHRCLGMGGELPCSGCESVNDDNIHYAKSTPILSILRCAGIMVARPVLASFVEPFATYAWSAAKALIVETLDHF